MQSGFDINQLLQEAQKRWLKAAEVLFILQNHVNYQITEAAPQKPSGGSLFLFNKRVLKFFRKDGHNWRKKKDGKTVGEAHERLKVGNAEALNCYYAHGEDNPNFQRRSYWMLDPAYEHIVLVHYRDITEGKLSSGTIADMSPTPSATYTRSSSAYTVQNAGSSCVTDFPESYQSHASPGSTEVSSDACMWKGIDHFNGSSTVENSSLRSETEVGQALRRLEAQLSLDDDSTKEYVAPDVKGGGVDEFGVLDDQSDNKYPGMSSCSNGPWTQHQGHNKESDCVTLSMQQGNENGESISWDNVHQLPDNSQLFLQQGEKEYILNANGRIFATSERSVEQESCQVQFGATATTKWTGAAMDVSGLAYSSELYSNTPELSTILLDRSPEMPLGIELSLTVAQVQRFTIREISPEWGAANESTKVIIIGSFLCDLSESAWYCMFGNVEVPLQIIQNGVLCCLSPPRPSGKVTLCITSGNREACSEIKEFEYREKHYTCGHCYRNKGETSSSTEEMLLVVRLVQMLLSNSSATLGDSWGLGVDQSKKEIRNGNSCDQIIEALLVGGGDSIATLDWLLQQLLKDKLLQWLSSRTMDGVGCSLSRNEQGVLHMIAGLGFEWALNPLLQCGVGINFRDINGWTALHWAAKFGREKMVAALIASGASALAVTDPSSHDPTGRNAAYIAAVNGHNGLAGYLSELALTSHLSSLTLQESELSKGSADLEAELTVNSISKESIASPEDQLSLKHTLAAVRNTAQAAARIQSAFRAHSFRKRQQKGSAASSVDEYGFTLSDIQGLSAASRLAFHNWHDHHKAASSIQKNYRGWKGRQDFVTLRQKVVKIQAHVRGYQVRKKYKVICWAVGILDKAVLRWRRKGAGLRGFRPDSDCIVEDEDEEDEDITKIFRKEKVDVAIDEAVSRVLSMVDSPEAREQYLRMLGKSQEAKAERQCLENPSASTSRGGLSNMDKDDFLPLP